MNYLEDLASSLRFTADKLDTGRVDRYYLADLLKRAAEAIETANSRRGEPKKRKLSVELCYFDREEIYKNCTVQVLTNSATGDVSVGWWRNDTDDAHPVEK